MPFMEFIKQQGASSRMSVSNNSSLTNTSTSASLMNQIKVTIDMQKVLKSYNRRSLKNNHVDETNKDKDKQEEEGKSRNYFFNLKLLKLS